MTLFFFITGVCSSCFAIISQNCQENIVNEKHDDHETEQIEHQNIDPVSLNCIKKFIRLHV